MTNLKNIFAVCIIFVLTQHIFAQESSDALINTDINTLFDELPDESISITGDDDETKPIYSPLQDFFTQKGFAIDTSYSVMGGYLPGWDEAPWFFESSSDWQDKTSGIIGAKMSATIGLDIRPSRFLRIRQSITFAIPDTPVEIKEFFFDYNFKDAISIKAGKYDLTWGYSPNYPYANLISRIPDGIENPGDPYIAQAEVPIAIGGLQLVMLTRKGFIENQSKPHIENFGFGGKYNIAVENFDIDLGFFYFKTMPLRFFYSLKTTLFRSLEFYTEGMMADLSFSCSLGFVQTFFNNKLLINAEFYYNGEGNSDSLRLNSLIDDHKETFPLFNGINTAFNIRYKPGGFANFQIFTGCLYSLYNNTAQLVPGIAFEPAQHLELYFAVPMAPGNRGDKTYYHHNADTVNRPFAFVFAVKINGSYKYGHID